MYLLLICNPTLPIMMKQYACEFVHVDFLMLSCIIVRRRLRIQAPDMDMKLDIRCNEYDTSPFKAHMDEL